VFLFSYYIIFKRRLTKRINGALYAPSARKTKIFVATPHRAGAAGFAGDFSARGKDEGAPAAALMPIF
jgi:hypothetical protein